MNNPDSNNGCAGLERFVVIFADDCMPEKIWCNEIETEGLLLSTANVIASDADEAIALASQADFDGHHRPVAALTLCDLVAMAEALVRCPFNARRRVTYTTGGYATAEQLERVAAKDNGATSVLEV